MTEMSSPPAPGFWLASDGNWYPPPSSPPPVPPKKEERPVIAMVLASLFLLFVTASGLRACHAKSHATQTSPATASLPAGQSSAATMNALNVSWFKMTHDQQVELCTELAQNGREATADDVMSGAENTLDRDGVVSWLEIAEDSCRSTGLAGG